MEEIYKTALLEIIEEDSVLLFKRKYNLESGFYKKPIKFFYWLFIKENKKIPEDVFKQSFIGRMIKFDKKNIPNYMELVFEYEKEKRSKQMRNAKTRQKIRIKEFSEARQKEKYES
jgi:hypothetical protein